MSAFRYDIVAVVPATKSKITKIKNTKIYVLKDFGKLRYKNKNSIETRLPL